MAQALTFDFQGHFRTGTAGALPEAGHSERLARTLQEIRSYAERDEQTPDLAEGISFVSFWNRTCPDCGTDVGATRTGSVIRAHAACPYPNGLPAFEVSLDVPSGKIVFANDFRSIVPLTGVDADHNVNQAPEMQRCTEDYAREGMIHVCVGNSCPQVRKMQDGTLRVQNSGARPAGRSRSLGNICTDLWWYSAMDAHEFARRCQVAQVSPDQFGYLIEVRVPPGAWSFSVDYAQDRNRPVIYSTIRRTGPCTGWTPPQDPFCNPDTFEASHFWASYQHTHTTLGYDLAAFLEFSFCVLGNGKGWTHGRLTEEQHDRPAFSDSDPVPAQVGPLNAPIPDFHAQNAYGDQKHGIDQMSLDQFRNKAACAPWDIDIHWLAAALVFFQGLAKHPEVLHHRPPTDQAGQIAVVDQTLAILDAIATQGNCWPELDRAFAEMKPVWDALNTPPRRRRRA